MTIAVFLSDTHGGHKLGLLKPGITLYEEDETGNLSPYTPTLTATQEYLWDCYREDIERVIALADGDRIVVFHCGDLTQGDKYKQQLVSTRMADQVIIAVENLGEWTAIPNVDTIRLAVGTGSHIFSESSSPVLVSEILRGRWDGDLRVVKHGLPTLDGIEIDYAHHGPSIGIRIWTEGNQLRYYLKSLMLRALTGGRPPPRWVFRGHFHEYWRETVNLRSGDAWYHSDIVLLPSYCGMGEYGRQATRSKYQLSNGLVALEIEDGHNRLHPFERTVDLRTREEL
jgi:hypothetical protein